jgi:hypothetical protein
VAQTISKKVIKTTVVGRYHIMGWTDLFPINHQRTGKIKHGLAKAEWHKLEHDTNFEGIDFAAGSLFKFWESQNFGWVAFHPSSKTPEGHQPGKFLFKY